MSLRMQDEIVHESWSGQVAAFKTRMLFLQLLSWHACLLMLSLKPPALCSPLPCLQSMLEKAGVKVMLNELSSTVVFERPREEAFVRKWQVRSRGT